MEKEEQRSRCEGYKAEYLTRTATVKHLTTFEVGLVLAPGQCGFFVLLSPVFWTEWTDEEETAYARKEVFIEEEKRFYIW